MEVSVMSINNKSEEQLIPGIVHADSGSENWCGLNTMAIDLEPINKTPITIPNGSGIVLGYRFSGAVKSYYQLGDDRWQRAECSKGEFMLVRAHEETKWCWHNISDEKESLLMLTINVEEPLINSVASEAVDIDHRLVEFHHRINQRDLVISDIAKRTYFELINNDPFRKISVDILKQELTVHLLRRNTVFSQKKEDCEKGLDKGKCKYKAIHDSAVTRVTPVLLTSLTTILGLLPLTLLGSRMWSPMGWAIIGGLLLSTLLTLYVVPCSI